MPSSIKVILSGIIALIFLATSVSAQVRNFTDTDGRTIKAEVVKVEEDSCVLSMNNREFTVPFSKLSDADVKYLREWTPPLPTGRPEINVNFSDRVDRDGYINDQIFDLKIKVENKDLNEVFPGGKLVVLAIVRHARDRGTFCVGFKETHTISRIGKLGETNVNSKRYRSRYYTGDYARGWRYHGHIAVLYNNEGKIVKTSVSAGLPEFERVLEAPVHSVIDSRGRILKNVDDRYWSYMMPELEEEF